MVGLPRFSIRWISVFFSVFFFRCRLVGFSSCAGMPPFAAPTLSSISVTSTKLTIAAGTTEQFTATGNYADGSTKNLTDSVTWSSQNPNVATVTPGGMAKAIAAGTSKIEATIAGAGVVRAAATNAVSGGVIGSTILTVTSATLVSIAVTPANPSIAKGTTEQFTATGTYSDNSTQNLTSSVTWPSTTGGVAP